MNKILEYKEKDFHNEQMNSQFICICPTSSNTVISQKKKIDPPGLTLVGFINQDIFKNIFDHLERRYNFQKNIRPHITILGLFNGERKLNPYYEKVTIEKIEQFFQYKEKYNIKEYKIKFKHLRPGTYYKPKIKCNSKCNKDVKEKSEPMYMLSNGTVIAMGDMDKDDVKKFRQDSFSLANYLEKELAQIFDDTLQPKYDTVWCTLGYFDSYDFIIDDEFFNLFQKYKKIDMEFILQKIHICKYSSKSLNDAEIIRTINLN